MGLVIYSEGKPNLLKLAHGELLESNEVVWHGPPQYDKWSEDMFRVLDAPHASEIYSMSKSWDWVARTLEESDLLFSKLQFWPFTSYKLQVLTTSFIECIVP